MNICCFCYFCCCCWVADNQNAMNFINFQSILIKRIFYAYLQSENAFESVKFTLAMPKNNSNKISFGIYKSQANENWQLHKHNMCITVDTSTEKYGWKKSKWNSFELTIYYDYKWACWQDVLCSNWMWMAKCLRGLFHNTNKTLISSTLSKHS